MNYIDITAKTIEEAIDQGCDLLENKGLTFDHSEVIESPSNGFLGFGKKDAKVRLFYKEETDSHEVQDLTASIQNTVSTAEETVQEAMDSAKATTKEALHTVTDGVAVAKKEVDDAAYVEVEEEDVKDEQPQLTATPEQQSEIAEKGKAFLNEMFEKMGLKVVIEKRITPDRIIFQVLGDDLGMLIGKHGQTLDAIQYLTNLVANKGEEGRCHIMVDVEGYRARREKTLQQLAKRLADKARRNRRKVSLEPMNAYERKIIHTTLQNVRHIETSSEGEGPFRHVVISYVK